MSVPPEYWVDQARAAVQAFFAKHPGLAEETFGVLLTGSVVTPYADAYSGLDLVAFRRPDAVVPESEADTGLHRGRAGEVRFSYTIASWPQFLADLAAYDDDALYLRRTARIVYDREGALTHTFSTPLHVPRQVWQDKAAERLVHLRTRQAALAWSLRRGQPFSILDNLTQVLTHALSLCFYLEGEPPDQRKWLFQGALRTRVGKAVRPVLFELFRSLGEIATLGGSLTPRENALYRRVTELNHLLAEAVRQHGQALTATGKGGTHVP